MLALGPYLVAVMATAVLLAALALASRRLRAFFLPGWGGAAARLAEVVIGIGLITTLGLVLGTVSLLNRPALLVASVAVAVVVEWRLRGRGRQVPETVQSVDQPPYSRLAAVAVVAVVFAHWGIGVSWSLDSGITNFDSVWYHLPFSAEMAQSGSTLTLVRTDTVFLNWLYPQGSELLHAIGMVLTGRDVASLALNLAWLGLAFLAAWCIGRPYGRGHLAVAAAAILLECHNLVAREPGTAKNDIVAIALLLAAVAFLVTLQAVGDNCSGIGSNRRPRGGRAGRAGPGEWDPGWPLALAALAVGLAAGTKVTALAPAAGLTLAALALSPAGRRWRAALWWAGGLALGGAYWYLRNIVVSGNPLPQVRNLGPIELPGPDRLQTGRPDFTVSHYLFDGRVWNDYLLPGLERGFGPLWPLVVAAAIAGALLAAWRLLVVRKRRDSALLLAWLGLAALIGMVAYLFTPLGAAGPEGSPTAFAINLRFVIPSLILGLVLLPLVLPLPCARSTWATFAALVLVGLLTNRADAVFTSSGAAFGWLVAIGLVLIPAAVLWLRAAASGASRPAFGMALATVYLVAVVSLCFPLQRGYFENRYADFAPELGLSEVYRWASDRQATEIGLAGTTLGFHGYGFYGADLSNRVTYIGAPAARGGFDAIDECGSFRRAVNRADLDYLVTAPFLNFIDTAAPIESPEERWVASDPALEVEIEQNDVTLWRVDGRLSETCGPAERPHRERPDTPAG